MIFPTPSPSPSLSQESPLQSWTYISYLRAECTILYIFIIQLSMEMKALTVQDPMEEVTKVY